MFKINVRNLLYSFQYLIKIPLKMYYEFQVIVHIRIYLNFCLYFLVILNLSFLYANIKDIDLCNCYFIILVLKCSAYRTYTYCRYNGI